VDGPPFYDIHAKQGRGFLVDYDLCQKHLGPSKVRGVGWARRRQPHRHQPATTTTSDTPPATRHSQISLSDFMRDMEAINSVYMPSAHKSFVYLRIGSAGYVATL